MCAVCCDVFVGRCVVVNLSLWFVLGFCACCAGVCFGVLCDVLWWVWFCVFVLIRRQPRSREGRGSAESNGYKRQREL
mgnify:CR=1 FL=1